MADPPSPTPSMASPEQHRNNGVLDPPPLQAFHEDESIFRNDLNFTLRITEKLTEQNYHLWRQQVEPYINAHSLDDLIGPAPAPPRFLTVADHASATLNPLYRKWRRQDQMLLSWLQSTLSSEILARFLGSRTSQDLWGKIVSYFHKQLRAKARTLRVELRSTSLLNRTVKEYLLQIRRLIDNLASIGDPVPLSQHIDIILEGLPSEFNSVISVVESRFESIDMDEIEALLLAHENRLDKSKKKTIDDATSINIAQNPQSNPSPQDQLPENTSQTDNSYGTEFSKYGNDNSRYGPYHNPARGRGGSFGRNRGGRSGSTGRNNANGNTQCQICSKPNHIALDCWYRHQPQSQNHSAASGSQQAPPPGYFQEAYGPYSGQNFPPRYGQYYGYGAPNPINWLSANPPPRFPTPPPSYPTAMLANGPSTSNPPSWYPDSGASFHVTGDSRNIQEPTPFAGSEHIYMGNGQSLPIISSGSSIFNASNYAQTHLILNNLLHVPSITKNLISVSQFAKDNAVYFEFHPNYCLVKSQATNKVLLQGNVRTDGLYSFSHISIAPAKSSSLLSSFKPYVFNVHSSSTVSNSSLSFNSLYLWHLRLGHPNDQTLKSTLKQCNIPFINNKHDVSNFCTACCMGKAHRLYAPASQTTYTQPLELVFSDLWGPSPTVSSLGF
ncbi:hypothetical protein TSUD_247490 [Trifolium subterraneum]|uniref:Uncharacterized protein n=1 Tax=Trifolium subterraneum TaxID=3900 RepID=A0A2Z6PN66_TRISU|nr:hypothetical protein TSUD_247490 [Trifolium subterraneum]